MTQLNLTLHLIQSPISTASFNRRISRFVNNSNRIVFLGDSVFSFLELNESIANSELSIAALDTDIDARGLKKLFESNQCGNLNVIDFEQFVSLTIEANKVVSW